MAYTMQALAQEIHENAVAKGFWGEDGKADRNYGEMLMLVNSELVESLEDHRVGNGKYYVDDKGKPEGYGAELIDAVIRLFDMLYKMGIDIEKATLEKMHYNESRPYKHGKAY